MAQSDLINECVKEVKDTTSDKKLREVLTEFYMKAWNEGSHKATKIAVQIFKEMS